MGLEGCGSGYADLYVVVVSTGCDFDACGVVVVCFDGLVGADVLDAEFGAVALDFVVGLGVACVDAYPDGILGCVGYVEGVAAYDVDGVSTDWGWVCGGCGLVVVAEYGEGCVNAVYGGAPPLGAVLVE